MKFKIYPWLTIDGKDWSFFPLPYIQFSYSCYDWEEDGFFRWFTIQLGWLIFGVTFAWRKEVLSLSEQNNE